MERIQPPVTALDEAYFHGCNEGRLRLQRCTACTKLQFYPRLFCARCSGRELQWVDATGNGRIASFTVVRRPLTPAYTAPYIVALIDLDEGPRMMSQVIDCQPEELTVGAPVRVAFAAWSETISLPVFQLDVTRDTGA